MKPLRLVDLHYLIEHSSKSICQKVVPSPHVSPMEADTSAASLEGYNAKECSLLSIILNSEHGMDVPGYVGVIQLDVFFSIFQIAFCDQRRKKQHRQ